ncbi:SDR family NAD(P)-dependent oxidoreductase [Microvirga puerhi]|uniref:SDR family NAD(P)-dependent oxidoreductase n=1 Tax=Microvirga puerhi TaxID=2876078 RepID=UPI0034E21695
MPQLRLDGRKALITGGAGGIGEAAAKLLHELGADVVIADVDQGRPRAQWLESVRRLSLLAMCRIIGTASGWWQRPSRLSAALT